MKTIHSNPFQQQNPAAKPSMYPHLYLHLMPTLAVPIIMPMECPVNGALLFRGCCCWQVS